MLSVFLLVLFLVPLDSIFIVSRNSNDEGGSVKKTGDLRMWQFETNLLIIIIGVDERES